VTTRRMVLTGAMMAPLLGILGQWRARADEPALYRIIDGWGEARLTPEAMAELRAVGATVYAVEPAELVGDPDAPTIRMPLDSGAFTQDFAQGRGVIAGGVGLRTAAADRQASKMSGSFSGTSGWGSVTLDDDMLDIGPLHTVAREDAVITVAPGPPGRPSSARVEAPLRATPEAVDLFTRYFGVPVFSPDMEVARLSGQCRFLHAG